MSGKNLRAYSKVLLGTN